MGRALAPLPAPIRRGMLLLSLVALVVTSRVFLWLGCWD
jgi:hypothetical protein